MSDKESVRSCEVNLGDIDGGGTVNKRVGECTLQFESRNLNEDHYACIISAINFSFDHTISCRIMPCRFWCHQ